MKMSEKLYCRTCLSTQDLILIFCDGKTTANRSKDLQLITGVTILPNDEFSQFICKTCNNLINDSLQLRILSQENDKVLRKKYNQNSLSSYFKRLKKNGRIKVERNQEILNKKTNKPCITESLNKDIEATDKCTLETGENSFKSKKRKPFIKKDKEPDFVLSNIKKKTNKFLKNNETNAEINDEINEDKVLAEKSKESIIKNESSLEQLNLSNSETVHLSLVKNVCDIDENAANKNKKVIKYKRNRLSKEETQKYMSLAVQPVSRTGPVRCALCRVLLREKRFFINHAKTHFEAEHECQECGKRFTQRNSLRYHTQRVHDAPRRLACGHCVYTAADATALQNHTRAAHTGERPYECDECGDTFRMRATIAQHMRIHFAAYDVQCERCPARFRSRSELASHRNKVHIMSYTYYCFLCPGTYKAVGTVKNHLVRVHGVPRDQHPPIRYTKTRKQNIEDGAKLS